MTLSFCYILYYDCWAYIPPEATNGYYMIRYLIISFCSDLLSYSFCTYIPQYSDKRLYEPIPDPIRLLWRILQVLCIHTSKRDKRLHYPMFDHILLLCPILQLMCMHSSKSDKRLLYMIRYLTISCCYLLPDKCCVYISYHKRRPTLGGIYPVLLSYF